MHQVFEPTNIAAEITTENHLEELVNDCEFASDDAEFIKKELQTIDKKMLEGHLDNDDHEADHHLLQLTEAKNVAPTHASPFLHQNYTNFVSSTTSTVLFATDEWFARAENLFNDSDPIFVPDLYCAQGKVMDGWETRRRRVAGHDWCIVALGDNGDTSGKVKMNALHGVELDTAFFTGNQTPRVSIQVANCRDQNGDDCNDNDDAWRYTWMPGAVSRMARGGGIQGTGMSPLQVQRAEEAAAKYEWKEILPMTELKPGYEETRMHYFEIGKDVREDTKGFTHVRVNYYPDGGVARLRLWGHEIDADNNDDNANVEHDVETGTAVFLPSAKPYRDPELSCENYGGEGLACSNKHYGVPSNLIREGYGKDMGDGWETARHPDRPPILVKNPDTGLIDSPLMDWAILKLGMGGTNGVSRIILDTKHFKGNFPESVQIEACDTSSRFQEESKGSEDARVEDDMRGEEWFPLLNRSRMGPDREHVFDINSTALVNKNRNVTHVRVSIFPDGGLSRVRIYGQPLNGSEDALQA
jgi:allantoicase